MLNKKIPGLYRNQACMPTVGQFLAAITGAFSGIAILAYLSLNFNMALMVPSFGASAVLLYAASNVPMAQPKNVLGGHLVSAAAGIMVYKVWGLSWWTIAIGVTGAIAFMMLTNTLHPPGGATAFAAVFGRQDYSFILLPVLAGALILLIVALVVHNLNYRCRGYPYSSPRDNGDSMPRENGEN